MLRFFDLRYIGFSDLRSDALPTELASVLKNDLAHSMSTVEVLAAVQVRVPPEVTLDLSTTSTLTEHLYDDLYEIGKLSSLVAAVTLSRIIS